MSERWVFRICFDGSNWWGWQKQRQSPTLQALFEEKLTLLDDKRPVKVTACSRTDRGVHARNFYFHADLVKQEIPWLRALNAVLPSSVRVLGAQRVPMSFCANRSAIAKVYHYYLYVSQQTIPWLDPYALHLRTRPSLEVLRDACRMMEGTFDFKAFRARGSSAKTSIRTLLEVSFHPCSQRHALFDGPYEAYYFRVKGSGFLKQMVRALVGTILDIASGQRTKEDLVEALKTGTRSRIGKTLPPHALWLEEVVYSLDWEVRA